MDMKRVDPALVLDLCFPAWDYEDMKGGKRERGRRVLGEKGGLAGAVLAFNDHVRFRKWKTVVCVGGAFLFSDDVGFLWVVHLSL
jgi:hypothetical protein